MLRELWSRRRRPLAFAATALFLVLAAALGANLWYENTYFISTENASIAGGLVQVSSPDPGRIFELPRDVGDAVYKDEPLAVVDIPLFTNLAQGGTRTTFLDARDRLIPVGSPVQGVIVARNANIGDTVTSGQSIFTVVDTRRLWVVANVEETRIGQVRPGQEVEVFVDALNRTLPGTVETVIPASTSTFSLIPAQSAAGNFTKVVQLVPVRIALRDNEVPLIVGASARVRIHLE